MNQNQKAMTVLRKIQKSKQFMPTLGNKLKLEDLEDFDNDIKQKLIEKLHPSKYLQRNTLNHFIYQAFIVNGILSERDRTLYQTQQTDSLKRDYIKRIQARYETSSTPRLTSGEDDDDAVEEEPENEQDTNSLQNVSQEEANKYRTRKPQERKINPALLDN